MASRGERERAEIDEELAFAKEERRGLETRSLEADHFKVSYDHQFAGRAYGEQVVEVLEQARAAMLRTYGRAMREPLEVRLYTKAHYLEAYKHRFGFATVGFYDGAIHVVSARRPRNELYALVVHEYVHALFKDAVGAHQPFFLNEGMADGEEERARGRPQLSREEWRRRLDALRADAWTPLDSLVQGFSGVQGSRALLAYLESRAAIQLIESTRPRAMAGFLDRCAKGEPWESALRGETGWDTAGRARAAGRRARALPSKIRSRRPRGPRLPSKIAAGGARMDVALEIALLWAAFTASHVGLSSLRVRPRLVGAIGELAFLGLYSVVALAIFVPLMWLYFTHKHEGPALWMLPRGPLLSWTLYLAMVVALVLLVASFVNRARPGWRRPARHRAVCTGSPGTRW